MESNFFLRLLGYFARTWYTNFL